MDGIRDLYVRARSLLPGDALAAARNAESDEERNFFAYVADMNLQRAQKKAVEQDLF